MIKIIIRNIGRFIFIVLLQALILRRIELFGFLTPYFYVIFLLLLPFETPNWALLVIGFLLGLAMDIFDDTAGIHASATVLLAFLRPFILKIISPRDGYETGTYPRLSYYGLNWFLKYSIILVLAHHIFLGYIDAFNFSYFFLILGESILNAFFTISLIILSQYLIYKEI